MITIKMITDELEKYDKTICTVFPGIQTWEIKNLEQKLKWRLPNNLKIFLEKCNGFKLVSEVVYGIHSDKKFDIYENYIWEKEESNNPIWDYLLPISPDGSGSHYCIDLKSIDADYNECKVVYWQHDYNYDEQDPPDVESDTILDFFWELLETVKLSNNYDGTDK